MKTLDEVADFHGHVCPGLAIGYRVASLALKEMGQRAGDEELVAIVENDSCAVDAVQVLTGCTFGKGNLIFRDHGKQVYTFLRRPSGQYLRISVDWNQPGESQEDSDAWRKYSEGDRSEEVLAAVHRRKSAKIDKIMNTSEKDLFRVTRGTAEMPHTARIHTSLMCEDCGEKTMETRARLLNGKTLCLPCFEKALK